MISDFENVIKKLEEVIKAIEDFEKKWGKTVEFKEFDLHQIVVPLKKRPSLLDRITGKYYSDLALEILSVADNDKLSLISVGDLIMRVKKSIPYANTDDVLKALDILKRKGLVTDLFREGGVLYVEFPTIYEDIRRLIQLFKQERKEYITLEEAAEKLDWSLVKAYRVLERMVELGILVRENFPRRYWLIKKTR
ncbi:MAG: hypothetical protein ACTSX9_01740 [Candidatus Njordarchaeales archaeon]